MNEMKVWNYEGSKVRTVEKDGEVWWVGKDVAEVLGYSNSRKTITDHVDEEDKGVTKCDTLGGTQNLTIINESGVYALIFGSKLPTAKKFKHWVTSEVLPSIRKTGAYNNTSSQDNETILELCSQVCKLSDTIINMKEEIVSENYENSEENREHKKNKEFNVSLHWRKNVMETKFEKLSNYYNISRDKLYFEIFRKLENMLGIHINIVYSEYCFANNLNYNLTNSSFMKVVSENYLLRSVTEKIVNAALVNCGLRKETKPSLYNRETIFD